MNGWPQEAPVSGPPAGPPRPLRLEQELATLLERHHPGRRMVSLTRMPRLARSSWSIEDLHLGLDDGTGVHLVWKDLDREALGSRARTVKPARVLDVRREPWVYAHVLAPARLGASCLAAVSGGRGGPHWLFLRPVHGHPLVETGEMDAWREAAAWLGRFHARHLDHPPEDGPLLKHDAALHGWWLTRAFSRADEETAPILEAIGPTHHVAVARVMATPRTLLHGEYCPANIVVDVECRSPRIVPLDWEMSGPGPAVLDLAAIVAGGWNHHDRSAMASAYLEGRAAGGAPGPSLEELLSLLDAAALLHAVRWLAWSEDHAWRPPEELRNDWLEEAVRASARLRTG